MYAAVAAIKSVQLRLRIDQLITVNVKNCNKQFGKMFICISSNLLI